MFITKLCNSANRLKHLSIDGSTAFCYAFAAFSVSWYFTQSVELRGLGISPSQGHYRHTGHHNSEKTHTDMHGSSGIQTHDPSVWGGEDSSYLRPRGYCARSSKHLSIIILKISKQVYKFRIKKNLKEKILIYLNAATFPLYGRLLSEYSIECTREAKTILFHILWTHHS
jgi:hypothetical protein